jgi:Flp pilus assembly protein protease CpaA
VRIPSLPLEGLKWGMAALMVFDHVIFIFFPDLTFLRIPGRLVWPMFAALMARQLAQGYPPERYVRRLLPFALLAQPFYALAFGFPLFPLNVLFTLLSAALLRAGWGPVALVLSLLSESPPGILLVELLARRKPLLAALAHGAWMWFSGWAPAYALLGGGAVLLAWALAERARPGRRTPWWALYAFYPGHLALLAAVKGLLD